LTDTYESLAFISQLRYFGADFGRRLPIGAVRGRQRVVGVKPSGGVFIPERPSPVLGPSIARASSRLLSRQALQ
jgi:hypothetical protein